MTHEESQTSAEGGKEKTKIIGEDFTIIKRKRWGGYKLYRAQVKVPDI